ncbi:hypothetical protein EU528_10025 [Candidatus Thorarchaeota archaeon]|nr:MAG: hypothetical protein EU528_10025 [Candidatus Thorarchaeota archaeon]
MKMSGLEIGPRQKAIIFLGLVIATTGFGLHFMIPGMGRSGILIEIEPMDTTIASISLSTGPFEQIFLFDFLGSNQSDFFVYFLSADQLLLYESGTPLSTLSEPLLLDENGRATYQMSMNGDIDLFLVLVNNGSERTTISYYYSLLPSTFFPSVTIGFVGLFLILIGFGLHYSGWKRYFLIGVGANLVFFLIRIFTLTTYSLGLPDIFINFIHVELYNDYQYFYLSWIPNLWDGAWAYSAGLPVYLYPPLWIYTVGVFGSTPPWLPGVVLFSFNVATGILVYKIAESVSRSQNKATLAMMIYLLNPITIGYGSFMWLNPTPFVFFVLLSFYLALNNRTELSIVTLGVATLYKQFAVIFFPIIALLLIKQIANRTHRTSIIQFIRHTAIYGAVVGFVSLPFLIVSPTEYINQLLTSTTLSYVQLTNFNSNLVIPVHFNVFFLWLFGSSVLTDIIAWLIYSFVLLALCGLVVYGAYATYQWYNNEESSVDINGLFMKAILWSFIAVLCLQTFFPRGAYKFYLLALMPFAALLFDYEDLMLVRDEFVFSKRHLFVPIIVTLIFLCYRFVYLWILVAWAWFYLIQSGELSRIRDGIRSFFSKARSSPELDSEKIETWEEIYSE